MSSVESLALSPLGKELLDDPAADPEAVAVSLENIARSNRWFGGAAAVRHGLGRVLEGVPDGTRLTLLDVGTGIGDLPLMAARLARRRGLCLVSVGVERSRVAARLARDAGLPTAVACAGAPPMRERSVDLVLVSQLVHHLARPSAIRLLRSCDRMARVGVIVADLRRSRLGPPAFWCGARALGFDPVTIADGMTSIRRGYTSRELRALLTAAGVDARVERRPGLRLVATWRPAVA
jgi:SAM-dependent methyltransferase